MISPDVLARYARDAAAEVTTVRGARMHGSAVEVHVVVDYGAIVPEVAAAVQRRVADYLQRMADLVPSSVDVVVDDIRR